MNSSFSLRSWWRGRQSSGRGAGTLLAPTVETAVEDMAFNFDLLQFDVLRTAPVSMLPSERLLLYTMVFSTRPQRYLEIGTLYGGSAAIVCAAVDALGIPTRMVLVDPAPRIDPTLWAHLEKRAMLVQGFSPDALTEAEQRAGGIFDFVLIDGDHSFDGTLRDLDGVLPHCAVGAYLLCHDCFYPTVEQAIDAFARKHAARVVDFGPLTRNTSAAADADGNVSSSHAERWGGIRVLQVRGT